MMFAMPAIVGSAVLSAGSSVLASHRANAGSRQKAVPAKEYRPTYHTPTYHPRSSQDDGIGLGTLVMGGLLFGAFD